MQTKNVRTKEPCEQKANGKRNPKNDKRGLGGVAGEGGGDGNEPNKVPNSDSEGGNSFREGDSNAGQTTAGGIASRLKILQQAYLGYIDADRKQLQACLEQNELRRQEIVAAMEKLESLLFKALGDSEEYQE